MARKKKKKSSGLGMKPVLMLMTIGVLGVGGFAYYVKNEPGAAVVPDPIRSPEHPREPKNIVEPPPKHHDEEKPTKTAPEYKVPVVSGDDVKLTGSVDAIPDGEDARVYIVTKTFDSLGIDGGRATGIQVADDGIAHVDVNKTFREHGFGSTEEGQTIKALQLALGQFKEVDRFQLYFEGQPLDSLGNTELTDPIAVIR